MPMLHTIARRLCVLGLLMLGAALAGGFADVRSSAAGPAGPVIAGGAQPAVLQAAPDACGCTHADAASVQGCAQASLDAPQSGNPDVELTELRHPAEPHQRHAGLSPHLDPPPPKAS